VIINYHANSDFRLDVCCTCALTPANMANVLILRTYAPPHDTLCSVAPTCTLALQSFAVYLTPVVRLCLQAIGRLLYFNDCPAILVEFTSGIVCVCGVFIHASSYCRCLRLINAEFCSGFGGLLLGGLLL
jgi:hypothetical protein